MIIMYKIKNIVFTVALLGLFLLASCDLEKDPYNVLPEKYAWKEYKDAEYFRKGAYISFRTIQGGSFVYSWDVQSDLFNATTGYGNRKGMLHSWQFSNSDVDLTNFWNYHYANIKDANYILDNIDKAFALAGDEKQLDSLRQIKGEMYLMRAMDYHALALRFAKDYEPSTASSDLGLPISTHFNISDRPSRSSLQETYKYIKANIDSARINMKIVGGSTSGLLTKDAIDAFEARVNLYMHNYTEAVESAKKIIENPRYALVNTKAAFTAMWLNDRASEIIFQPIRNRSELGGEISGYLALNTGSNNFQPDYVPSKWVLDLYDDENDFRTSVYFINDDVTSKDETVSDVFLLNKYPGNPALISKNTEYYNMFKALRSAEAYLIAAEASYMAGNETDARTYLNMLREAREAYTYPETLTGTDLFNEIKDEWTREFIGEGKRMDDLRRWHLGFNRHDPQNPRIIANTSDVSLTVEASNMRFVWEIPSNDLSSNPNLVPNWR